MTRQQPRALLLGVAACTLLAGTVAAGHGLASAASPAARRPSAHGAAPAAVAAKPKVDQKCTPTWNPHTSGEPWQGKAKAASEKTFLKRIGKENPGYVRGKHGVLFFTDYQAENFSQALGRVTQSPAQQRAWARFFAKSQAIVKAGGGNYHIVVAPANWDVDYQDLPGWAQKLRGTTSLNKLMAAHPELPWVDPRPAMKKAARRHDTYEPLNSHWTPYGGYVAWKAITRCLNEDAGVKVGVPPISGVTIDPNSNEFAANGVPDGKPKRTVPVYTAPHPPTVVRHLPDLGILPNAADDSVDMLTLPVITSTPGAQSDQTLMVFRDSTGSALSPLWSWSFQTTVQDTHGINNPAGPPSLKTYVATYHPKEVLFVITERYLTYAPPPVR